MPLLCRLLGHRMRMKTSITAIWFECERCHEHGWRAPRAIRRK